MFDPYFWDCFFFFYSVIFLSNVRFWVKWIDRVMGSSTAWQLPPIFYKKLWPSETSTIVFLSSFEIIFESETLKSFDFAFNRNNDWFLYRLFKLFSKTKLSNLEFLLSIEASSAQAATAHSKRYDSRKNQFFSF